MTQQRDSARPQSSERPGLAPSPAAMASASASAPADAIAPQEHAPATKITIAPARFGQLWETSRLQRRAFTPRLAYSYTTLVVLWLLPQVRLLIAMDEATGQIAGCGIGDRQGGHSRIINLAVDPDLRRRGIGTQLLRALESALPMGNVLLMVEETNAGARALYEREGYVRVGFARDYYGRDHHGIWMQKRRTDQATARVRF